MAAPPSTRWGLFDAPRPLGNKGSKIRLVMGSESEVPQEAPWKLRSPHFPGVADVVLTTKCHSPTSARVWKYIPQPSCWGLLLLADHALGEAPCCVLVSMKSREKPGTLAIPNSRSKSCLSGARSPVYRTLQNSKCLSECSRTAQLLL